MGSGVGRQLSSQLGDSVGPLLRDSSGSPVDLQRTNQDGVVVQLWGMES